jgi:putative FmdB family regulatory protein
MPIFDYECDDCHTVFENVEVWSTHKATKCKVCGSPNIHRIITSFLYREHSDVVRHNLPDPIPPLEEYRGRVPGLKDKPYASRDLKDYVRRKDKYGNTIWEEKRKMVFDMGK